MADAGRVMRKIDHDDIKAYIVVFKLRMVAQEGPGGPNDVASFLGIHPVFRRTEGLCIQTFHFADDQGMVPGHDQVDFPSFTAVVAGHRLIAFGDQEGFGFLFAFCAELLFGCAGFLIHLKTRC